MMRRMRLLLATGVLALGLWSAAPATAQARKTTI